MVSHHPANVGGHGRRDSGEVFNLSREIAKQPGQCVM